MLGGSLGSARGPLSSPSGMQDHSKKHLRNPDAATKTQGEPFGACVSTKENGANVFLDLQNVRFYESFITQESRFPLFSQCRALFWSVCLWVSGGPWDGLGGSWGGFLGLSERYLGSSESFEHIYIYI